MNTIEQNRIANTTTTHVIKSKKPIHKNQIISEIDLIKSIQSGNEQSIRKLFNKYKPIVNKMWRQYFIKGMEIEDWYQESMIVLVRIVDKYDCERGISFGSYYRQALKNRFFDLIRRKNAQKRFPDNLVSSFEASEGFYSDTLVDTNSFCPEKLIFQIEKLSAIFSKLSKFESRVFGEMVKSSSISKIANKYNCSEEKVINAFERCKRKFNQME